MTYTMTEKENSAETHQRCDRAVPLKRKPGIDKMTKPALDTTDRLIQAKKTTATLYGTYAVIYPHCGQLWKSLTRGKSAARLF